MSEPFDYLVVGSSTFSRLLAGLLRERHGRSVLYHGDRHSPFRLPRALDLSVAPITRPDTWSLLEHSVPETIKIIGQIAGRGAWRHVDPLFSANSPAEIEALGHIRHMAQGFGLAAEQVPPTRLTSGTAGLVIRDALCLDPDQLEPALDAWLAKVGVIQVEPDQLSVGTDGAADLSVDGSARRARQTILSDAEAISRLVPSRQWPALLRSSRSTALLIVDAPKPPAPVMMDLRSGATVWQPATAGISAIGPGDAAHIAEAARDLLGADGQLQIAGQSSAPAIVTSDGAAAVGRISGIGADVTAGLGPISAFMAPALARWMCGEASPDEAAWFGARLVSRTPDAPSVAEFAPTLGGQ